MQTPKLGLKENNA